MYLDCSSSQRVLQQFDMRCEFHDCSVVLFYYKAKFANGQHKFWGSVSKDFKDLRFLKREPTRI